MAYFMWKQEEASDWGHSYSLVLVPPVGWNRDVNFVPNRGPWQRIQKLPSVPEDPLYTQNFPQIEPAPIDPNPQPPKSGPSTHINLYGRIGLACYNLQKGTNLQFCFVHKFHSRISSIWSHLVTLEALDPIHNSRWEFETNVRHAIGNRDCLSAIITRCRLTAQTPVEDDVSCFDKFAVDSFFRGGMPDWMPAGALTPCEKLQCYEMKESELEEENEWLQLYAELALYSKWQSEPEEALESAKPFELRKIIVRTKEDVKPEKKVKAENAIFYISFKTRCGRDCNAIIRKTTDGLPEHSSLEVKCLIL